MMYALELNHVGKEYENFCLHDISFQLEPGIITGLIGTNGAGKSTLIQMILGLLIYDGSIKINGMELTEFEKETKDYCGFVLDENPFITTISPIANARMLGPFYSSWNEKKFLRYCNQFEVNYKKPLYKLSQGAVTKFQLAFALAHDARLLVFDEPSSGLDPIFRRELMDIMYDITMDGERSILFSTHLTQDLDNVADYIVMLHKGNQIISQPKDELLDSYWLVRGTRTQLSQVEQSRICGIRHQETFSEALVKRGGQIEELGVTFMRATIEDIMFYMIQQGGESHE